MVVGSGWSQSYRPRWSATSKLLGTIRSGVKVGSVSINPIYGGVHGKGEVKWHVSRSCPIVDVVPRIKGRGTIRSRSGQIRLYNDVDKESTKSRRVCLGSRCPKIAVSINTLEYIIVA